MRVLMVSQRLPPYRNTGAERQALLLARALRDQGVTVSFLTTRFRRGLPQTETVDEFPVDRLPTIPGPALKPTQFLYTAAAVARQAPSFDLVHGHCLSAACLGAIAGSARNKTPVMIKPSTGPPQGEIDKLEISVFRPVWRHLARRVSAWAVLSKDIAQELARVNVDPGRCFVLDNGVDRDCFQPSRHEDKNRLRENLQLPAGPGILFAGQLTEPKGVQQLIDAWPRVRARCANAWLAIAGDGPLLPFVTDAAKRFNGSVYCCGEMQDIAPWFQAADVFVLPTRKEGHSNAILEALSSGLPVVTGYAGADRYSENVNDAFIKVDTTDSDQIAAALTRLLENHEERRYRGSVARAASRPFAIERIAARYLSVYEGLLRQSA